MDRLFYPPIRAAPIQSASCNGPPAPPNFNVGHCDARHRAKARRGLVRLARCLPVTRESAAKRLALQH